MLDLNFEVVGIVKFNGVYYGEEERTSYEIDYRDYEKILKDIEDYTDIHLEFDNIEIKITGDIEDYFLIYENLVFDNDYTIVDIFDIFDDLEKVEYWAHDFYYYLIDSTDFIFFEDWEIDDFFQGQSVVDILNSGYFGNYNPNHDYYFFDGYGNIDGCFSSEFGEELKPYLNDYIRDKLNEVYLI